ncbi:pentatricopeptide repeat-containing protein, chloroplastic [Salvia divinorum]|uniref:Pentatricopeptide repeat-containing protein, chloroplastic n=1 Tax=Salvia divinorum TaxID=28513 RepID=A0ABD1G794_SALDI
MATVFPHMQLSFASISTPPPPPPPPSLTTFPLLKLRQKPSNLRHPLVSFTHKLFSSASNISLDQTYASFLDHCAAQKSLPQGKQIHALIIKRHNVDDFVFLATKLVLLYGKCGSLLDAEDLFDEIPQRSIFAYNALVGAYVSYGETRRAIQLYADMRFLDVPVDAHTCSSVLKACAGERDTSCGREIHGYMIKLGFLSNDIAVNSLVTAYARCDDVGSVKLLFDRRSGKCDVVLWNLMISTHGLTVFGEMLSAAVTPTTYTFVAALRACKELSSGVQIHALIFKYGLSWDRYVANALLFMYSECSRVDEAERVFINTDDRDSVSWNSMLAAYVQNGLYDESLDLFREITMDRRKPDGVAVITALSACGRSRKLLNGMEVHAFALKNGFDLDLQVGNTIIDMYAKCCKTRFMDSAFRRIPQKDFISWTTIISGYVQNNDHMKALDSFREVLNQGICTDRLMIESVLIACRELKSISVVKEIHGYVVRRELSDIVVQNTIVDAYGECGEVGHAKNIFELIEMKNVVSWTSMVDCYVRNGLAREALDISHRMVRQGVELDSIAVLSILSAAANLSASRKGKEIHGFLVRRCLHFEGSIASSLVDMYGSCGAVDDARKVFDCAESRDLVLWTSLINGYGLHGQGKLAIELFRKMEAENVSPDRIAFLAILCACSHSALVDEGQSFFNTMRCQYGLEPWPQHYACLVDLLGRANRLQEALELVEAMEMEPTAAVWCALLGACRIHSNMEVGEIAARKLLEMKPKNPGNYVLISNMFAAAERWEDVEQVRMRMKLKGLKKEPGCSWMEIGDRLHTFITRDRSHPRRDEIYKKLAEITESLERGAGYKTDTSYVLHNVEEVEKVRMLHGHSERLALAYGLLTTPPRTPLRITKNLRVCGDCHTFTKLVSKHFQREIVVRDANRFHHFKDDSCSCKDFW